MPPKQAPDRFQYRDEREKSFTDGTKVPTTRIIKVWKHEIPSITSLVDNGFYYTPTRKNQNQVTCFWCGKKENDIVGVQALGCHHLRTSPKCAYGLIQSNMEYCVSARDKEEFWRTLAEEERAPRSVIEPHSSESVMLRASTFKDLWKLDGQKKCTATSRDLAKAGLYYSPLDKYNDRVICMYCDCPLDHWDPEDDPLREHRANSYAYCYFLDTLTGGKQNGTSSDNRNGADSKKTKVPLPDDSLDDIDDSIMSTTPVPSPRVKLADKEHDSTVSSPLNESVSKWPSPLPSTEPELHKDSEFDAYDFSIEDIEDPDHGSIFDDGKSRLYHRKPRLRKPPPPPPESLAKKKSSKGSFMLEVDKSRESDESTNRSMTLTHTNGEHKQSLQTSESPLITEKVQRPCAAEETVENVIDGASDKSIDVKNNPESTGQSEVSLIESDDLTPSMGDGSKFTISENDSSYEDHGSAVEDEQRLKNTAKPTSKVESGNTKKRLLESFDGSMDSDRFKQILASPGKKKKVKLNQAEGAYKPKDDILDLSGHNIGDFNESNISYLEEQRQSYKVRDDEVVTKKRPILSTELSTKVKKSAFDDDDDDFDFFVHRSNKLKGVQKSDHNEEPAIEKSSSSLDKNSLLDISASTDVEMAQQRTPKGVALNLNGARKAADSHLNENDKEGSVDKDMQNAMNDQNDDADHTHEQSFNLEHIPRGSRECDQKSTENVKDRTSNDGQSSERQTDQTPSKYEKHSLDNTAPSNPEGGQTSPTDHDSAGEKTSSPIASSHMPNLELDAKISDLDAPAAPASVAESKETTIEEYVDTRAEFDDSKAETPTRLKTENADGAPTDEENFSNGESDFTLSPSTYGDYVKDMRSMEDEFVDSSVMQESKSGGLMIEKSSKSNILGNVDEYPIDEQGGMVLFDEHNSKNEPERIIVLEKAPPTDKASSDKGKTMSHQVQRISADKQVTDTHNGSVEIEGALETKNADNSDQTSIGDVSMEDAKPVFLEASERDDLAVATKEEKKLDELNSHAQHASETVHNDHVGEQDAAIKVGADIPMLRISEGAIQSISSPSYNESPHNRTFIEDSLPASVDERDDDSIEQERQEEVSSPSTKQLDNISGSFIESSTPRKNQLREDAVYKCYQRFDASKLGNTMDELKTLTDTMHYLAEVSAASCELHNDNEGILTDFIAAMPEEEEAMTVKEWMQHNAATCGRTVRAIAERMIDAYAAEFDNLIEHVAGLPTTD